MHQLQAVFVLLGCISGLAVGRSVRQDDNNQVSQTKTLISSNFIGEATNDLTTAMLQECVEEEGNMVFSPLGYSTILAMLAEGARGDTRSQLVSSLRYPEDLAAVRQAFKDLLSRMKDKEDSKPEFKNWFYAYKNYTILDQYREILLENYLTEVKSVEIEYNDDAEDDLLALEKNKQKEEEKEKNKNVADKNDKKEDEGSEQGSPSGECEKKKVEGAGPEEEKKDTQQVTESSKEEDNKVETQNNQEKPAEVTESHQKDTDKKVMEDKKEEDGKIKDVKNEEESTKKVKARRYFLNKDTVTALTANRLSSSRQADGEKPSKSTKRVIIFNGFYYKGNWSVQFEKSEPKDGTKTFFYTSDAEKKPAKMMTTVAEFEVGEVPQLRSTAIEIPYEGDKYSLLVLLPHGRSGLKQLASDLKDFPLTKIDGYLKKKQVRVCLPKANFYTISKPRPALLKSGVKDLFNKDADLSGINSEGGLYLDELVQLVTMNFEETSTATNFLTSSLEVTRSNAGPMDFNANHPFFFFLRERQDGIILAAGKLQDPTKASHDPTLQ